MLVDLASTPRLLPSQYVSQARPAHLGAPCGAPVMGRRHLLTVLIAGVTTKAAPVLAADNPAAFSILYAQRALDKIVDDESTLRTMLSVGLPLETQLPSVITFAQFQSLERSVSDPDTFMDAAIEFIEYSRDARDLVALATLSRTNGAGPAAAADYFDRAMVSIRGARSALKRLVPLIPAPQ